MATNEHDASDTPSRDRLALARTELANERTLLAYARTSIMLAATGATVLQIFGDAPVTVVSGWALIVGAIGMGILGGWRFHKLRKALVG